MADIEEMLKKITISTGEYVCLLYDNMPLNMEFLNELVEKAHQNGIQEAIEKTIKEFLTGKRCIMCGDKRTDKEMKNNPHTDTCPKCWEEE